MIASTKSLSITYLLISEDPDPASPVNSDEPFWMIAILPVFLSFFTPFNMKSICPSEIAGRPGPNLPSNPFFASASTSAFSLFQSMPNGGYQYFASV